MGQDMKQLVRSLSNIEPRNLRLGFLVGCFLISLTYFSMTKPFVVILPTINNHLLTNNGITNAEQLGFGESVTEKMKIRCNVTDPNSELCKEVDVLRLETDSKTTNETSSAVQEVKEIFSVISNMTEKSSSNNDPKLVQLEDPQSRLADTPLETNKSVGYAASDSSLDRSQNPPHEDDTKVAQNSILVAFPSIKESLESDDAVIKGQKVEDVVPRSIEKKPDGDPKVVEKPTPAVVLPSSQQLAIKKSSPNPSNTKPLCDFSNRRTNICELSGDIRLLGNISTVHVSSSSTNESYTIQPYPRKSDLSCMSSVRKITVLSSPPSISNPPPICTVHHTIPAIIFSVSGYSGNYFHAFVDVLVPLFLTARKYDGNVVFVVTNLRWWWVDKYLPIFKGLSKFQVIDFDNDNQVHCFTEVVVGLKADDDLKINPRLSPYSMVDFTSFIRSVYDLKRHTSIRPKGEKTRLLLISRGRTRRFMNVKKIARSAEKMGFEVVVAENDGKTRIAEFAQTVNSCDVMMGVHGAGLTNVVFLPTNAALIQIVPWGKLDWVVETAFGGPARDMNLKYLEYRIGVNESTLIEQYPMDDPVIADPMSIHKLGWVAMGDIYLVKQNVRIDVRRFRKVLSTAMKLVPRS